MSLDGLIEIARVRIPQVAEVNAAANALEMSVGDLCDELSRTVAKRFVQGVYSFTVADFVMNNLFGFAHAVSGEGLPALSWDVYLAFDAGEYEHPEDPPELQGEYKTRVLLAQIASLGFPPVQPITVLKVRIDEAGRLRVIPASNPNRIFQFIYRAEMEVEWDDDERGFYTPVPQERSYADWYSNVLSAVKSEMGVLLLLDDTTSWENVPPSVEQDIRQRFQTQ